MNQWYRETFHPLDLDVSDFDLSCSAKNREVFENLPGHIIADGQTRNRRKVPDKEMPMI
jgi:hypothetical protein